MKIRMLTAIAASALCITAFSSAADAGGGKRGGGSGGHECNNGNCGGGGNHHGGGHHGGGHHGGGHHGGYDKHDKRDTADRSRGCDDHWDSNLGLRPNVAFNPRCGQAGLGVTIIGIPGGGFYEQRRAYGYRYGYNYGYRPHPFGWLTPY